MNRKKTFGNTIFARKISSKFASAKDENTIKVTMLYTREIQEYINDINEAHKRAERSKLRFK